MASDLREFFQLVKVKRSLVKLDKKINWSFRGYVKPLPFFFYKVQKVSEAFIMNVNE